MKSEKVMSLLETVTNNVLNLENSVAILHKKVEQLYSDIKDDKQESKIEPAPAKIEARKLPDTYIKVKDILFEVYRTAIFNSPDYILTKYLLDCLATYSKLHNVKVQTSAQERYGPLQKSDVVLNSTQEKSKE